MKKAIIPVFIALCVSIAVQGIAATGAVIKKHVLVYPFENTGSREFSWVSAGLSDSVLADLGKIPDLTVISESDRKRAVDEIALGQTGLVTDNDAAKVGKLLGAHFIFAGSYAVVNKKIRIIAKLIKVESGSMEKVIKLDGDMDGIFELQDKLVISLISESNAVATTEKLKPIEFDDALRKKITQKSTSSLSAYQLYAKGLETMYVNPRQSMEYLEQAIAIEPNYKEALKIAGYVAGVLISYQKSLDYFSKSERLYRQDNEDHTFNFADLLMLTGGTYYSKGEYDRAIDYFKSSQSVYHELNLQQSVGYAHLLYSFGSVYVLQSRLDEALDMYQRAESIFEKQKVVNEVGYGHLMYGLGYLFTTKKDFRKASGYFVKAQRIYIGIGMQNTKIFGDLLWNLGYANEMSGNKKEALKNYQDAIEAYKRADYHGDEISRIQGNVDRLSGGK
jgi:tetratricopeptide (TPR) repeat protein/TolB-like protein